MRTPDLRFHIASLAAVFLALGIGILIGTAFVGAPIVQRQTGLIRRLEGNVASLRQETREGEASEEALRRLLPRLVAGTLAGRRVLVVQSGPYADAAAEAADVLTAAGAAVNPVVLPVDAWRGRLEAPEETPDALTSDARRLAPLLLAGAPGAADALQSYREEGLVSGGDAPQAPAGAYRLVVLVGGAPAGPGGTPATGASPAPNAPPAATLLRLAERRDAALIEQWRALGATVVGVEPAAAGVSFVRAYQAAGVATIDNIDRAAGKLALPFALRGERADYGQKPTADRVLPESLEGPPPSAAPPPAPAPAPSPTPLTTPSPSPAP